MNIEKEYSDRTERYKAELKSRNTKRNFITASKVILFAITCFGIFKWINTADEIFALMVFPPVIIYIILNKIETRLLLEIDYYNSLITIISNELKYLKGDFSAFSTGDEYLDNEHPYAKDLDLFGNDSIFQALERCETPNGRDFLANVFLNPELDHTNITERQAAVSELSANIDLCLSLRATMKNHPVTKVEDEKIEQWKNAPLFFTNDFIKYGIFALNIITCSMFVAGLFYNSLYTWAGTLFVIQLSITLGYNSRISKSHNSLDSFINGFGNYLFPISIFCKKDYKSRDLKNIQQRLYGENNSEKAFRDLKSIVEALNNRGNLLANVLLNGAYMRDLHTMMRLDRWKKKNIESVNDWKNSVSELETLISFAFYKYNNPSFTFPVPDNSEILESRDLIHPLLFFKNPVANDFDIRHLHQFYLVTGANMSGKSTFLRAVGINLVLALSGSVVSASSFKFTPMMLFTSMRTSDNLSSGTSYFHAEILRLKSLLDIVERQQPIFVILDEILKGTNSHDKLNGSRRFLIKLFSLPTTGVIATHDLELGELETSYPDNVSNICFEVEYNNNDLTYDYKLRKGVSHNMNASFLLEKYGLV